MPLILFVTKPANHMDKAHRNIQIVLILLLAAILSLILLKYANPLLYPPGRDGGAYMFGGRHVLHGKILYIDYWEAKGPMIFFINAMGLLIGRDSRWGIWLVECSFWVFSAVLGLLTLKKRYGLLSALIGISMMMLAGKQWVGAGNFTEEYSLLFTWISVFAFFQFIQKPTAKLYPIILGAMLAVNFFIRANNCVTAGVLILIGILHTTQTKPLKAVFSDLALVIAGAMLITIPITLIFLFQGTFGEMITASIIYNFAYSFGTRPGFQNLNIWVSGFLPAWSTLGAWMLLPLIGFILALFQFIRKSFARRMDWVNLLLVILWPLEMLASSISGRNYGHYFLTWLPSMALLSAFAVDFIAKLIRRLTPHKVFPKWLSTGALGLSILLFSIVYNQDLAQYTHAFNQLLFQQNEPVEYIHPIAAFITEHSDPEDLVLVWGGQTGMLFMSERFSPTAFNFYPLYANSRIGREIQRQYFDDLQQNQPKLILDAHIHVPDALPSIDPEIRRTQRLIYPIAQNHAEVLDYINANYELILDQDGYQVYQISEP